MEYYEDVCEIKSFSGTDDDGELIYDIIYSGKCSFQFPVSSGTHNSLDIYQSSPTIFIPSNSINLSINDYVEVTYFGRVMKFTILQFEPVKDDEIPELNDTCIWLKGGVDAK